MHPPIKILYPVSFVSTPSYVVLPASFSSFSPFQHLVKEAFCVKTNC